MIKPKSLLKESKVEDKNFIDYWTIEPENYIITDFKKIEKYGLTVKLEKMEIENSFLERENSMLYTAS